MRYLKTNNLNWKKLCKGELKVKQLEINLNDVYIEKKNKLIQRKWRLEEGIRIDIKE